MTPNQFFESLATITKDGPRIFEAPIRIKVGDADAMAGKLLIWLQEQMPEATQGELLDVMLAAWWWMVLFGSEFAAEHPTKE